MLVEVGIAYLAWVFLAPHCACLPAGRELSHDLPIAVPPVAKKVPFKMEKFGDVRVDNYYWLRDDTRSKPEVLGYLNAENAYADSFMNDTKILQEELYQELMGRESQDDTTFPKRKGSYYYYDKSIKGKDYVQHCRRPISSSSNGTGMELEQVYMDENVKAQGHDYYQVGAFTISPNDKLLAYGEDITGYGNYTVYVIDVETGNYIGKPVFSVSEGVEWVNDDILAYITIDEAHRPDKVWLHKLGTDQRYDRFLHHEKDEQFSLLLYLSQSMKYLIVSAYNHETEFFYYFDTSNISSQLEVLMPHVDGESSIVSDRGDYFFIIRSNSELYNGELIAFPVYNRSLSTVLIPHSQNVQIQDMQLFVNHLVVFQREDGLQKLIVYDLPSSGEHIEKLNSGRPIKFSDPVYKIEIMNSQFNSSILTYSYSSSKTPTSIYDYDLTTGTQVLRKIDQVKGGFSSSNYVAYRLWATASDGVQIPISIFHRTDIVKLDGSNPLFLYAYGAYGESNDVSFATARLSLVDRGFIHAVAHVRGGSEMGRQWYYDGKLFRKRNTFTDFIACAEHLINIRYTSNEKLCISGESAGGLLIGAVVNMRPDLFKVALATVPFVDVLTTMLDKSLPLTTNEYEEWGDPEKQEFYFYMKSYAPVDNVISQNYPHMLVSTGLNDDRVIYSEPTKYVAKLRDMKTDNNTLLFKCNIHAGHFSDSGRYQELQDVSFRYAFVLKMFDMASHRGN